jgi:hypothetical protein
VRLGLNQKESGVRRRSLRNGDNNGALAISGEDDGCRCSKSGREAMVDRFDLGATKVGARKSFAASGDHCFLWSSPQSEDWGGGLRREEGGFGTGCRAVWHTLGRLTAMTWARQRRQGAE